MEEFLPSEIARAVYGYLISEGCEDAATSFLETSSNLVECKQRVKHGKRLTHANTLLLGKSLVEVLNIACSVHSIVKQISQKQQKGVASDGHESLANVLDQLRTCVFSDSRSENNGSCQALSQLESPGLLCSPSAHHLRTPPGKAASLADTYRSLVQECSEGLDLSMSPEKVFQKNKNVGSPCRQSVNKPQTSSVPGALGLSQLDMDNESAVAAITGFGITPTATGTPKVHQVVTASQTSSSTPSSCAVSNIVSSSTEVMTSAVSTVMTSSHFQSTTTYNDQVISAGSLPDPPIIVLNGPNQSFEGGDSAAYFSVPPCAASTPHQCPAFMPEDTAFILYPPAVTDPKPKKAPLKEKTNLRRSGRLRKLLPKPARKDPPHIIHLQVLPQTIDEENEENNDEVNEMELAKQLPNSEEKIIYEDGSDEYVENEINVVKNIEVVATTSDKENISDESLRKESSIDKSNKVVALDCEKEISTPRPPTLRKNISRSTPRRNSHVRALSFNTPNKPIKNRKYNTSPKMPRIKFSPRSAKLSCVKRSSLFSPKIAKELSILSEDKEDAGSNHAEISQREIDQEINQNFLDDSQLCKIPIATRSPAPKLSSAWQEVNDVKITEKPVWDETIRNFALGDFEDPAPPPKKGLQDKQAQIALSPNKGNKSGKGNKSVNNQSPKMDVKKVYEKKDSKSKKRSVTTIKSRIKNNKIESNKPINTSHTKQISPAKGLRRQSVDKHQKSFKKIEMTHSDSDSTENSTHTDCVVNEESRDLIAEDQINAEDKNKKVVEVLTDTEHKIVENDSIESTNILLEDLVVSSNSCFTQSNDEVRTESNSIKIASHHINTENKNETIFEEQNNKTTSTKSVSPAFIQSNVVVLDTPLKEFQVCDPKTFTLTTPLVKSIRPEISILEEDLLLTPSLPPTPQLNSSSRNFIKTPCKTVDRSPNKSKEQRLPDSCDIENKSAKLGKTDLSPFGNDIHVNNMKGKSSLSSNTCESEIEGSKNDKSTLKTQQIIKNKIIHNKFKSKPFLSTSSDTSESENDSQANYYDSTLSNCKKNSCKKNEVASRTRNRIYSTTESSDDETTTRIVTNSCPRKTKLSKLASVILENERKSLNKKSKKIEAKKRGKIQNKKDPLNSAKSVCSPNSNQDKKEMKNATRKKNVSQGSSGGRKSRFTTDKSPNRSLDSKESVSKQSTPENMRQQLQSDLLKQERQIIFGDRINSTSDSESDIGIFEPKKPVVTKAKSDNVAQKKKTVNHIELSEDSSTDTLDESGLSSLKTVKFNIVGSNSILSQNKKNPTSSLTNNKKTSSKCEDKIKCSVNNDPSTESSGFLDNLIKDKLQLQNAVSEKEILKINVTSALICDRSSKLTNAHNILAKINDNQSSKNFDDNSLCGPASNLCSKDVIPNQNFTDCHRKLTSNSIVETELVENHKSNSFDSINNKEPEKSMGNSNNFGTDNHNTKPPSSQVKSPSKSKEKETVETNCNVGDNEICITSTSTSERINVNSTLYQLDLDRQDTFQVDEGNVILSYSQIIEHYYYSPTNCGKLVQNESTEVIRQSVDTNHAVGKKVNIKEETVKRRIKLIPIEDDKYEQKLQVDYDQIDEDNFLVHRGNRRLSCDTDILECSTNSILSLDAGYVNKQSFNLLEYSKSSMGTKPESFCINQQQNLDAVKPSKVVIERGESEIKDKSEYSKQEIENNHSRPTKNYKRNSEKHVSFEGNEECQPNTMAVSRSRNESHHSQSEPERKFINERERNKTRYEQNTYISSERRRDRDEGSRYDRLYDRRERRRYSERQRRESDRRGYSERRNHSSHRYHRRGSSPEAEASRHRSRRYSKISTVHDTESIEHIKKSLAKIEKHDLDRVDELEEKKKIDPRATQVLTYSDVEKNESSRDEADSLMDFAVISKTKVISKTIENVWNSPSYSSTNLRQDPTKSNKRKATNEIRETPASVHVEKKLKLGEVEMKEAKSVLRHKMADMLNVLHPDTSSEAT